jgi:hypothetical protein
MLCPTLTNCPPHLLFAERSDALVEFARSRFRLAADDAAEAVQRAYLAVKRTPSTGYVLAAVSDAARKLFRDRRNRAKHETAVAPETLATFADDDDDRIERLRDIVSTAELDFLLEAVVHGGIARIACREGVSHKIVNQRYHRLITQVKERLHD